MYNLRHDLLPDIWAPLIIGTLPYPAAFPFPIPFPVPLPAAFTAPFTDAIVAKKPNMIRVNFSVLGGMKMEFVRYSTFQRSPNKCGQSCRSLINLSSGLKQDIQLI